MVMGFLLTTPKLLLELPPDEEPDEALEEPLDVVEDEEDDELELPQAAKASEAARGMPWMRGPRGGATAGGGRRWAAGERPASR